MSSDQKQPFNFLEGTLDSTALFQALDIPDPGPVTCSYSSTRFLQEKTLRYLSHITDKQSKKEKEEYLFPMMEECLDRPRKRLAHALQRIKSKGYYARTMNGLFQIQDDKLAFDKIDHLDLVRYAAYALCKYDFSMPVSLSDDVWYMAIECAMRSLHPEAFADPQAKFGAFIDRDIPVIYAYLILLSVIYDQTFTVECLTNDLALLESDFEDDEDEDVEADQHSAPSPDTGLLETLRQRIAHTQEALSKEKKAHDKTILRYQHEIDRLKKESEAQINSLKEQNAQLLEFILHRDREEEPIEDPAADPVEQEKEVLPYPLPDSRVLFLGGHRNFVKKVEAIHPDWLFLSDNNIRTRGTSNIDVIFFWTAHASHRLQEKVFSALPDLPPIIYVKSTNIELLEQEMLRGYNALKKTIP